MPNNAHCNSISYSVVVLNTMSISAACTSIHIYTRFRGLIKSDDTLLPKFLRESETENAFTHTHMGRRKNHQINKFILFDSVLGQRQSKQFSYLKIFRLQEESELFGRSFIKLNRSIRPIIINSLCSSVVLSASSLKSLVCTKPFKILASFGRFNIISTTSSLC